MQDKFNDRWPVEKKRLWSRKRERFILDMREKGSTLNELASLEGVTKERIRQIVAKARMRRKLYQEPLNLPEAARNLQVVEDTLKSLLRVRILLVTRRREEERYALDE